MYTTKPDVGKCGKYREKAGQQWDLVGIRWEKVKSDGKSRIGKNGQNEGRKTGQFMDSDHIVIPHTE
jgi:hypothetical protein